MLSDFSGYKFIYKVLFSFSTINNVKMTIKYSSARLLNNTVHCSSSPLRPFQTEVSHTKIQIPINPHKVILRIADTNLQSQQLCLFLWGYGPFVAYQE